ncbi:MAG: DUF1559 domain-containing protein [Gemmataceae bacterium]
MTQSTQTLLLPYIEQDNVFKMMDQTASAATYGANAGNSFTTGTGAMLHRNARGAVYNDPAFPNTIAAAKTQIKTFICPSTPIAPGARSPDGFGVLDYMVTCSSDIEDGRPGVNPVGTVGERPSSPRRLETSLPGMLTCEGGTIIGVTDGSSNTLLMIEDASRSHPSVGTFGSGSSRFSVIADGVAGDGVNCTTGCRRMYAWADPDAGGNGTSGPSNATGGSRQAKINNYASPVGGPPTICPWSVNHCGPNDEAFSFHTGGVNALMGDGSVRFIADSISPLTLRYLVAAADGQVFTLN